MSDLGSRTDFSDTSELRYYCVKCNGFSIQCKCDLLLFELAFLFSLLVTVPDPLQLETLSSTAGFKFLDRFRELSGSLLTTKKLQSIIIVHCTVRITKRFQQVQKRTPRRNWIRPAMSGLHSLRLLLPYGVMMQYLTPIPAQIRKIQANGLNSLKHQIKFGNG